VEEADDYNDARMLLEDEWLVFVTQTGKQSMTFSPTMKECGIQVEKKKFDEECRKKPYYMKNIQQLERCQQRIYDLQESILKRQRDESDSIRLERHCRMYAKYFHPKRTRTI
jgi:hypothetical protein